MRDLKKLKDRSAGFSISDRRVAMVIGVMNESFADHLSVATLSKRVNLSSTRLRELFSKETGVSPLRYLRELRMQHAERLLRNTFLSVKEIAAASGIKDVSHFVRDFKRRHGWSPTVFRARVKASETSDRFEPSVRERNR